MINITVVYALPEQQYVESLQVPAGTTALQALQNSGLAESFPDLDLQVARIGVYARLLDGRSNPLPGEYRLAENDRVEVYRPLTIGPNEARLLRAKRAARRQEQK